jgi:hypothetical protein
VHRGRHQARTSGQYLCWAVIVLKVMDESDAMCCAGQRATPKQGSKSFYGWVMFVLFPARRCIGHQFARQHLTSSHGSRRGCSKEEADAQEARYWSNADLVQHASNWRWLHTWWWRTRS